MSRKLLLLRLLLLFVICWGSAANGQEIDFKQVAIGSADEMVLLDMAMEYELHETMLEALHSGVPLTFEIRMDMKPDRAYFWKKSTAKFRLQRVLRYHPLASQYEVKDINSGKLQLFATMSAALRALGHVRSEKIVPVADLDPEEYYLVKIQAVHDISALPLPLRPLAYLTPSWHLESRVYEWRLKP